MELYGIDTLKRTNKNSLKMFVISLDNDIVNLFKKTIVKLLVGFFSALFSSESVADFLAFTSACYSLASINMFEVDFD